MVKYPKSRKENENKGTKKLRNKQKSNNKRVDVNFKNINNYSKCNMYENSIQNTKSIRKYF